MSEQSALPRILIVDDLAANLHAMRRMLKGIAVDVDEALGGEQALEMLLEKEYAVVLLDVQMPDMSGYEVAEMMGKFEATKYTPIVFVTANAAEEISAVKGYEAGAIDYIFKPLNKAILLGKLKVLLQLYEQRKQTEKMNSELKSTLRDMQAANAARDVFLANMSHEMRTPLNGIIGATDLIGQTTLNDVQKNYNGIVLHSSEILLSLINDVLDFSKLESDNVTLVPEDVDLYQLIKKVVQLVSARAAANNVELLVRFAEDLPRVAVDQLKVTQILVNLLGNAIKFSKDSYVLLELEVLKRHDDQVEVAFKVEDGGIGISADRLSTIFDRFVQEDSTTTKQFGGTGLGLAICQKLVTLMGGSLSVESEVGEGSLFSFDVNLDIASATAEGAEKNTSDRLLEERVLIVDSSPMSARILKEMFDSWSISCKTVGETQAALHELDRVSGSEESYSILLIDLASMQGQATDFARQIRDKNQSNELKIIVQSSVRYPLDIDESTARELFDGHIIKPVYPSELLDNLLNVLDESSSAKPSLAISEKAPETAAPKADSNAKGMRVLVVEDSPVNQVCAEAMLAATGCIVVLAENGQAALEKYMSEDFDLILMDCMMPIMDGYEATRKIREIADGDKRIPIIAMTANALEGDKEKCLNAGMDDYITKPIRQKVLVDAIEEHLAA